MNIEVDGMQHLTDARQILSDLARGHYSNELGYQTIHIHNSELHHHLDDIADALAAAARERMRRKEADSKKSDNRV
jgi:very-short-patch-repair endonuclease